MPLSPIRCMPSQKAIREYWAKTSLWRKKGYDSPDEFLESGTCFACGMDGDERAHIKARIDGGDDSAGNLHILCGVCHRDSECLDGFRYLRWLLQRNAWDSWVSAAVRRGFNISEYISRLSFCLTVFDAELQRRSKEGAK